MQERGVSRQTEGVPSAGGLFRKGATPRSAARRREKNITLRSNAIRAGSGGKRAGPLHSVSEEKDPPTSKGAVAYRHGNPRPNRGR